MKNVSFTQYELKRLLGFYHDQYRIIDGELKDIKSKLKELKEEQARREQKEEEEKRKKAAKEKSKQMQSPAEEAQFRQVANDIRNLPWDHLIQLMLNRNGFFMQNKHFLEYSFEVLKLPKSHKEVIDKEIQKAIKDLEQKQSVMRYVPEDAGTVYFGLPNWFRKNGRPYKKYFKK